MKVHQGIFEKIKLLLKKHFGSTLEEYEAGMYLTIADTGIWISCDDRELTVGYGLVHTHYDPEFDDIQVAIDSFFNLLTKRKRITRYYKESFEYKNKRELLIDSSNSETIGTAMTWLYPYWKRTIIKEFYEESLIDPALVEAAIEEIKNYAHEKYSLETPL